MIFFKVFIRRVKSWAKKMRSQYPEACVGALVAVILSTVYAAVRSAEAVKHVVHVVKDGEFKGKPIMGSASSSVNDAKEHAYSKMAAELLAGQKTIADGLQKIDLRVADMEKRITGSPSNSDDPNSTSSMVPATSNGSGLPDIPQRSPSDSYHSEVITSGPDYSRSEQALGDFRLSNRIASRGPDIVTFPVASESSKVELAVTLPVGSYVKAKIIAGTDATAGEPNPVLLQLDYSNILPNQRKLDMSGCFMTAKAQADLSTERVKMKTMKLSCVSKHGMVFEKEVNGYVADDVDNKFAVGGPVNSKQDRVAAMAFLASVVEGVGKAVQQAQTTQQTTPLGGNQSVVTGDDNKYLAGGAAANAAGVVSQWYLKQAENLLPSITVGSGRDVWVVILDNVSLPNDYFKKGTENDARFSYLTRILD